MDIHRIKGSENDADVFTKNLDGPAFEKCIKMLVGQDAYIKKIRLLLSKESVTRCLMVLRRALGIFRS
jgi:hypothetical protein